MIKRTYSDMSRFSSFFDRYDYLRLRGSVGVDTFGHDRHVNQRFYRSVDWKRLRARVILRDNGCDLGIPDRPIHSELLVHHMNPISLAQLTSFDPDVLDEEYLICVSKKTHNAIHFGAEAPREPELVTRQPWDTKLW